MLMTVLLVILRIGASHQEQSAKDFIPTSVAIQVARDVALGQGYRLNDNARFYFDIMTDKDDKPLYPGYVTIGFYWDDTVAAAVSVNERTGQAADIGMCRLFDYPKVRVFAERVRRVTKEAAKSVDELMQETGCESITILSKPVRHR